MNEEDEKKLIAMIEKYGAENICIAVNPDFYDKAKTLSTVSVAATDACPKGSVIVFVKQHPDYFL